jgi:hypothetical protein
MLEHPNRAIVCGATGVGKRGKGGERKDDKWDPPCWRVGDEKSVGSPTLWKTNYA